MIRRLRPRSAYDVVGLLALFVALGGTAYAAATIGSSDIKKNAVLSKHIKDGQVKKADLGANSVGSPKVIDGSLLRQDFKAGQLAPSGPGEAWHELHAYGSAQPAFGGCSVALHWHNYGGTQETVAFYRDAYGVVHLKGTAEIADAASCPNAPIFNLPPGYRPGKDEPFPSVEVGTNGFGVVTIAANGDVLRTSQNDLTLNGIEFRCAPAGANGCR